MFKIHESRIIIAAWVLLAFVIFVSLPGKNSMMGFVVYEGGQKTHPFAIPELSFNSTAMNSSAGELKFNLIVEEKSYDTHEISIINVSSAIRDGVNDTLKIKNIDGEFSFVDKNSLFNVNFNKNLSNNDKIQVYLIGGSATDIYLCQISQNCANPGYGKVNFGGGTGYYNITLSNMLVQMNDFNIDPPVKVKFDHIRAVKEYNLTYHYNISYYPMQALIETADFMPDSVYAWHSIVIDEQLNGQVVEYYYSTDSGSTWNYMENKDLGSAPVLPGKIRFGILLTSDSTNTPIVRGLSVTYSEKITCNPDWQPDNNQCGTDDSMLMTYTDANSCNATENLPADNGTYAYCDFCMPEWQDMNSSCLIDDTINQYFVDANGCYGQTGLSSDNVLPGNNTFSCDFCTPSLSEHNTSCYYQQISTTYYMDANSCYDNTDLISDLVPANITQDCPNYTANTTNNTQPNITNATGQEAGPGLFKINKMDSDAGVMIVAEITSNFTASSFSIEKTEIDTSTDLVALNEANITVDDALKSNISALTLRFYYNETMLNSSNANESTLAIYYYDEEYDELQEIPSVINASDRYVEANVTHLSLYGLYGRLNYGLSDGGGSQPAQTQQETGGGSNELQAAAETQPQNAENADQQQPAEEVPAGETAQGETAEGAEGLSLEPGYNSSEGINQEQTFYKIGKTLGAGMKNRNNLALGGAIILMLVITYVIIEIKARKGNST